MRVLDLSRSPQSKRADEIHLQSVLYGDTSQILLNPWTLYDPRILQTLRNLLRRICTRELLDN